MPKTKRVVPNDPKLVANIVRKDGGPLVLTIGAVQYRVIFDEMKGEAHIGECYPPACRVGVQSGMPIDRTIATLWHEFNHAVILEYGIDEAMQMDEQVHERLVSIYSPAMLVTMRANPDFLKMVMNSNLK